MTFSYIYLCFFFINIFFVSIFKGGAGQRGSRGRNGNSGSPVSRCLVIYILVARRIRTYIKFVKYVTQQLSYITLLSCPT